MSNRYLYDKAMRRAMRDGRNPYGSRGGYVSSRKRRDRGMDYEHNYPERDSRYYDGHYEQYRGQERYMGNQQPRERHRPMDFEMYGYGIGGIRPMNDYGYAQYPYPDMRGMDYASMEMEKEWKEDLYEWCEELKRYDRFKMPKEQVIQNARQMGVAFDMYNEDEFLTTFYMVMSDYPTISNEPHTYLSMAKDWLEDKDSKLKGSDKLCAYYYEVINAGEK